METPCFPMFIDLSGKEVLVAGGGNIALRRVRTLLAFGARIRVTAPRLSRELEQLASGGKIKAEQRTYQTEDIKGMDMVLAATDDRETNRRICTDCRAAGIPVNVADDRRLCDFYFPSVVLTDDAVVGISCGGGDHAKVKELRRKIEGACGMEGHSLYEK
ncbi:MAG TPA: bifunctional precorrin-2 dehydrogenase/sirohydrochlorin ferrochelatase [Candidatus Mediterraneibacter merdipullorum]|nr:bifunctional precorrin-2 dehydrogenase/sirohydrochlorin ferrochelatase [Candidatus Mediterraneibacter merdipullorum]